MTAETDFSIRFWGVRGSIACPGPDTVRYGGNTACIEVRCGEDLFIIDAGTGIRALGNALKRNGAFEADILLTHTHLDHISGLPFFGPAYDPKNHLRIWAGHLPVTMGIETVISYMMSGPILPVPIQMLKAVRDYIDFRPGEILKPRKGVEVRTCALNHPNGACGFRIDYGGRSACIISDTEHVVGRIDQTIVDLVRGADLMVYDSMYTDAEFPGFVTWGHSTWEEACRVADAAGVSRVALFHHDPMHNDEVMDQIGARAAERRPGTVVSREGMILYL